MPVHCDLAGALAAHGAPGTVKQWTTDDWPTSHSPEAPALA